MNGGNVGTNSSSFTSNTFSNTDVVTCELTSSLTCATPAPAISNSISVTVNSNPVASCSVLTNVNCFGGNSGSIRLLQVVVLLLIPEKEHSQVSLPEVIHTPSLIIMVASQLVHQR